jgi:hypothetical protein
VFNAAVLVGTPSELLETLDDAGFHGRQFVDTLDAVILDEVDVLLPVPREYGKYGVHGGGGRRIRGKSFSNTLAAKRRKNPLPKTPTQKLLEFIALHSDKVECKIFAGSATASRKSLDRINSVLRSCDMSTGKGTKWRGGVLKCVRIADSDADSDTDGDKDTDGDDDDEEDDHDDDDGEADDDNDDDNEDEDHNKSDDLSVKSSLITPKKSLRHPDPQSRYVLVPKQVKHLYAVIDKNYIMDPNIVIGKVAQLIKKLRPKSSLIFICGSFVDKSRIFSPSKDKILSTQPLLQREMINKKQSKEKKNKKNDILPTLSAQKACEFLRSFNVKAEPLHVALGLASTSNSEKFHDTRDKMSHVLELHSSVSTQFKSMVEKTGDGNHESKSESKDTSHVDEGDDRDDREGATLKADADAMKSIPSSALSSTALFPCYVTFEGLARGLHFEGVDTVFVIGRPSSLASYLHISGRVGRHTSEGVKEGSVVSIVTHGGAKELSSWAKQIGAEKVEEILVEKVKK